jgi:hypothetical protein
MTPDGVCSCHVAQQPAGMETNAARISAYAVQADVTRVLVPPVAAAVVASALRVGRFLAAVQLMGIVGQGSGVITGLYVCLYARVITRSTATRAIRAWTASSVLQQGATSVITTTPPIVTRARRACTTSSVLQQGATSVMPTTPPIANLVKHACIVRTACRRAIIYVTVPSRSHTARHRRSAWTITYAPPLARPGATTQLSRMALSPPTSALQTGFATMLVWVLLVVRRRQMHLRATRPVSCATCVARIPRCLTCVRRAARTTSQRRRIATTVWQHDVRTVIPWAQGAAFTRATRAARHSLTNATHASRRSVGTTSPTWRGTRRPHCLRARRSSVCRTIDHPLRGSDSVLAAAISVATQTAVHPFIICHLCVISLVISAVLKPCLTNE